MSNKAPWKGPRLLVPLTIDALVITRKRNSTVYSIQSLDLKEKYAKFEPISPPLFQALKDTDQPDPGVHVNWALPDGMTKGLVKEDGTVDYPYLPNRWMISRTCALTPSLNKTWIVKSDELYDTKTEGQKVHPQFIKNNNGMPEIKYIGRWYDLDKFKEEEESRELILTAVGNSDPLFTAYTGNNTFIYSFIDKFTDSNARIMSYTVAGWYSNSEFDIMYTKPKMGKPWATQAEWIRTMNRLQWAAGSPVGDGNYDLKTPLQAGKNYLEEHNITPATGPEGELCAQSLCHGLVFNVEWPGLNEFVKSAVPVPDGTAGTVPYVAAANAATDCISAFMQWQLNYNKRPKGQLLDAADIQVEKMLEAFNYKMLNQPGGVYDTPELDNTIREAWFGKIPGGIIWEAQAPPKAGELHPDDNSGSSLAQLPDDLAIDLAALNVLQHQFDEESRKLVSLQRQLYADWLKFNIYNSSKRKPPLPKDVFINDVIKNSADAVDVVFTDVSRLIKAIDTATIALKEKLAEDFVLEKKTAPDFYRPNDPVVLINNAKRSFKRGEDIIYSDNDDFLYTRFSGQFIKSIEIEYKEKKTTVVAKETFPQLPAHPDLPLEVYDLVNEAYLLDVSCAEIIRQAVTPDADEALLTQIRTKQTLVWNKEPKTPIDERSLEKLAGFNPGDKLFRTPSKIAIWKWAQPWTPLYLEWKVGFVPVTDLSKWQFDGKDYNWKAGDVYPEPKINDKTFSGRSLLTPKEAVTMQARLKEFIDDFKGNVPPDFVPLKDVLNGVGNWDVLSQTLNGFGMQMMQWDLEQFGRQPQDEYKNKVGNQAHGMFLGGYPDNFFPVRAGFLSLKKLWVVDDFGQVYDLTPGSETSSHGIDPVPGIGVRPGHYNINLNLPSVIQLPPRVVQGSRLNFNFLSAGNDKVLSSQSAQTSPVCGWLLPNHLNHSVMVYNKEGFLLGEIMLMGATGKFHAQWVAAPLGGSDTAHITNKHLQSFVLGLLGVASGDEGTPQSGKVLRNFLQAIDESLWGVDPMGERNNQSLSILVGRPIAVVRASVDMELYGNAGNNLAWLQTGLNNDGGIKNYQFPVQIGNIELGQDGVMGYFANNDYSTFNSVHNGVVKDAAEPPYVTNSFTNLKPDGKPVYITMLLDPRGGIHCSSGILPVLQTELPEVYIGKVLDDMLVEFKTGPLLIDKKQWWLPLPAGVGQSWSWLEPGLKEHKPAWTLIPELVPANSVPQFSGNRQTVAEGRLRLSGVLGGQMVILAFEVPGQKMPYKVKAGDTVKLSWATQGAVSARLTKGTEPAENVPLNHTAYEYKVTKTQDIKLAITNGKQEPQELTINIAVL